MCDGCKVKDAPTDFGAFVHAYIYAKNNPKLRQKVVRKARKLFLVEGAAEAPEPPASQTEKP